MNTSRKRTRRLKRELTFEGLDARRVLTAVLDTSFDGDGLVTTDFTEGGNDECRAVALQEDGRIVVVGVAGAIRESDKPDDMGGGGGGGGGGRGGGRHAESLSSAMLVEPLAKPSKRGGNGGGNGGGRGGGGGGGGTGEPDPEPSIPDFALARYLTTGELDPTFGDPDEFGNPTGKVVTDFSLTEEPTYDEANGFVILPEGNLLVVGSTKTALEEPRDFALAIYDADGELQSKTVTDFGGDEFARKVAIQGNKVVVVGTTLLPDSPTDADILVARYELNGILDTSFGDAGKLILDFYGEKDEGVDVLVKTDYEVIVVGHVKDTSRVMPGVFGGPLEFGLAQLRPDGELDTDLETGFGAEVLNAEGIPIARTGMVSTDFNMLLTPDAAPEYSTDEAWAGLLQEDGKILVSGRFGAKGVSDFGLARYTALGDLDTTFGMPDPDNGALRTGVLHTDIAGGPDACYDVAVHNGEIVVPGRYTQNDKFAFAMVRYDTSGNEIEIVAAQHFYEGPDQANAVAIEPDGHIVLAGWASMPATMVDVALARYEVSPSPAVALMPPAEEEMAEVVAEAEPLRIVPPGWSGQNPGWGGWNGHPWGHPNYGWAAEIAIEELTEEEDLLLLSLWEEEPALLAG